MTVRGYRGYKAAGNVHGSRVNHAILLGMDKRAGLREPFPRVDEFWNNLDKGELRWVSNAPCQEIVVDKNINCMN